MMQMENIVEFLDWQKLDLRVGKILEVEDIDGADKLYKISVDIGNEKSKSEISTGSPNKSNQRIVCAGLKPYYGKEELVGRKIILFVNLAPRKLRGIESQGMVLASVSVDEKQVKLIKPDEDVEVGSKIR